MIEKGTATGFYGERREAMDAGAEVAWEARYDPDIELSALQHAFNMRAKVKERFDPEYQNEPVAAGGEAIEMNTAKELASRIVRVDRGQVPQNAERLTAFIDVQQKLLWWMVVGWRPGLGGHIIDYGAWPDQKRANFTKRDAKRTYAMQLRGEGFKAELYNAMSKCVDELLGRTWIRDDDAELRIERCFIDEGWGKSTDTVFRFCRESEHAALLMPSKGDGLRAQDRPIAEREAKPGQQIGHHWMIQKPPNRPVKHIFYDTNRWKTLIAEHLRTPVGNDSALTLFRGSDFHHQMLFDHLTAEKPTLTSARGQQLETWAAIPNRDNDLLDCLVGTAVAASTLGLNVVDQAVVAPTKKRRSNFQISF